MTHVRYLANICQHARPVSEIINYLHRVQKNVRNNGIEDQINYHFNYTESRRIYTSALLLKHL